MTDNSETQQAEPIDRYEARSPLIQHVIELLATTDDDTTQREIADRAGCTATHVSYVSRNYDDLIDWYRTANLDPLEPEAVEQAYDDEDLADMAADDLDVVADGAGNLTFSIDMTGQQAFRAMKLLPGDLGMTIFQQVLSEADEIDEDVIAALYAES